MQRKPIIKTRRPIQKPLFTIDDFLGCNSCIMNKTSKPKSTDIVECCNGTPLVTIGDFEKVEDGENYIREYIKNNEETPFFLVHYDNYKNPKLPQRILEILSESNIPAVVTASKHIPQELLVKMSANPFNIVQMNLTNLGIYESNKYDNKDIETVEKIQETLYNSKTNGLQTIIRVEPVIPSVVPASSIIEIMNSMRFSCNHLVLKFAKYKEKDILSESSESHYNIEGLLVSKSKFKVVDGYVHCSADFVNKYVDKLEMFKQDLSISVCGVPEYNKPSCFGIELKPSTKITDAIFTFKIK